MEFSDWKPWYEKILKDFGYSREEDRKAAALLADSRKTDSLSSLKDLHDKNVEIGGPYFDESEASFTIAAGSAVEQIWEADVEPDLVVTDLDGDKGLQLELNLKNIPVVIHAHGDNIQTIERWAKRFEGPVISTCQCEPKFSGIYNFGGFTDGDRACFISDHFDADKIVLNGWDFENPFRGENREKTKKLSWAKRLIKHLDIPIESL
ncbi:MAG: 6-hydroxymethylpterin diphosphokinase MptE-like protein [Thermoplasmata archaeon]